MPTSVEMGEDERHDVGKADEGIVWGKKRQRMRKSVRVSKNLCRECERLYKLDHTRERKKDERWIVDGELFLSLVMEL